MPSSSSSGGRKKSVIYGKGRKRMSKFQKFKWCLNAPETRGRRSIKIYVPAVRGDARQVLEPIDAWKLLLPDSIISIIVEHTNTQISFSKENHEYSNINYDTSVTEIKALLGLLYFIGAKKQNHVNLKDLWNAQIGENFCQATMSYLRFLFLLGNIRFDDKVTRAERRQKHGLAPIKEVWDLFLENCQAYYVPSTNCTIDEQLLAFRGRFKGKVYIPKKPAKYGIKIVSCNDVQTSYMFDAEPYVGKGPGNSDNSSKHYITSLTKTIHNSERNVTCDNWFTQIPLVQEMKKKIQFNNGRNLKKK